MTDRCAICRTRRSEHAPWTTGPDPHQWTGVAPLWPKKTLEDLVKHTEEAKKQAVQEPTGVFSPRRP